MQYIGLAVLWSLYFLHHSLLSSGSIKAKLLKAGVSLRTQRLIYSLISTIGLLLLLFYNGALGGDKLLPEHRGVKAFALFLAAAGVFIIREAFKAYNFSAFLGFTEESKEDLKVTGILAHIRHPLYSATILIFCGFFLYDSRLASLISLVCVLTYLPLGIWLEEKKLIMLYGEKYVQYTQAVPALLPNFRRK
ncbi:MAG: NnrU family protein [Bacteroidota bacterium]